MSVGTTLKGRQKKDFKMNYNVDCQCDGILIKEAELYQPSGIVPLQFPESTVQKFKKDKETNPIHFLFLLEKITEP